MLTSLLKKTWLKVVIFILALVPALLIGYSVTNINTADPAKVLVDQAGLWALRFLWLCLLLSPLRYLTHEINFIRYRRMLGLFAFFYATVHVFSYWFLLFGAQWSFIWQELSKRPYIMVGSAAYILLIPLAVTSTKAMQKRLKKRWFSLHKSIYVIALLAITHFTWLKKLGVEATAFYIITLLLMLIIRLWHHYKRKPITTAATS